jgi:hypothetical protein
MDFGRLSQVIDMKTLLKDGFSMRSILKGLQDHLRSPEAAKKLENEQGITQFTVYVATNHDTGERVLAAKIHRVSGKKDKPVLLADAIEELLPAEEQAQEQANDGSEK